ncbi:MAG: response regulator [Desulfobacula sp.]|nr:response regulator [Desulfobacula sp.]
MNITQDKILVVATETTTDAVKASAKLFPNLDILTATSENKAFELIYNHSLVLVIIEQALTHIEPYKIGSMLLSHKQIHNTPLLILCDTVDNCITQDNFLSDFEALQIDHLLKPFTDKQIRAKIRIFFELFKQKNAVHQSINELDLVYQKIIAQHEHSMQKNVTAKKLSVRTSIAATQIQESLRNLQGNIYQLLKNKEFTTITKSRLSSIKTASEKISTVTKKLVSFPNNSKIMPSDQAYKILYAQGSDEDFSIFNHFIKGVIKCDLFQAKTTEQSLKLISQRGFDLIFIDYLQPEGTGFDLLSKLNRMRSDIPVIFTLSKPHISKGADTVSKGAFAYIIKEELSSTHMLSIINNTLEKASLTKEVDDAQSRIVMISKKDYLTKLYNRRCF